MVLGLLISRESVASSSPVTLYTWKTGRLIVFKKCLLNGNKTDEWVGFMLDPISRGMIKTTKQDDWQKRFLEILNK